MKKLFFWLGVMVLIAGSVGLIFALPASQEMHFGPWESTEEVVERFDAIREDFIAAIKGTSAKKAHAAFVEAVRELGVERSHLLAHAFGEALYTAGGVTNFVVCDSNFGFGCQHGFAGKAIAEQGIEVIKELDRICVETYTTRGTGCSHGIGHGILGSLGDSGLIEALEACKGLSWQGEIAGCGSGVFMEYNFRTMEIGQGRGTRPFALEKRHEPCKSELPLYVESCYFEQPSWWRSSLEQQGVLGEAAYGTMGMWCAEASAPALRDYCYLGIGNVVPPNAGFSVERSVALCASMPDDASELLCRKGAAWGFFTDPAYRAEALTMCTLGASPEAKAECEAEYQLI